MFGSWCEPWAAHVHVSSSLQKETSCTKLDLPFLKNETCLSRNRNPVWKPESVGTAAVHLWEALTALEKQRKTCGCLTLPFQFRLWSWGDQVNHCSLSWRGSVWGRSKEQTRLRVSRRWAGWKKLKPKIENQTYCTGTVSLLVICKNTCAQVSLRKHQFCMLCSSSVLWHDSKEEQKWWVTVVGTALSPPS